MRRRYALYTLLGVLALVEILELLLDVRRRLLERVVTWRRTTTPHLSEVKQERLAVASIARDDPSPLPGMHRDHNSLPSQTDGQTDTDIVA